MPKFYICSDIHGFYDEFREALGKSGFDENNLTIGLFLVETIGIVDLSQ